jgi:hypothetical protein
MATLLDGLASEGAARSMAFCGGNGAMVYGVVTRRG